MSGILNLISTVVFFRNVFRDKQRGQRVDRDRGITIIVTKQTGPFTWCLGALPNNQYLEGTAVYLLYSNFGGGCSVHLHSDRAFLPYET